jgi:hypothetical protein
MKSDSQSENGGVVSSTALLGGNSRTPKFGEWMRGIWAGEKNPHRDGMYVRTVRRTGRMNPGKWYELTDGNGDFWQYEAKDTLYLPPNDQAEPR